MTASPDQKLFVAAVLLQAKARIIAADRGFDFETPALRILQKLLIEVLDDKRPSKT